VDYELQSASTVGPLADWQGVTNGITINGNVKVYGVLPAPAIPACDFRLRKNY
jgi:hypothetical protein